MAVQSLSVFGEGQVGILGIPAQLEVQDRSAKRENVKAAGGRKFYEVATAFNHCLAGPPAACEIRHKSLHRLCGDLRQMQTAQLRNDVRSQM